MHIYPANKVNVHYKLDVLYIKGQPIHGLQASNTTLRDPPFYETGAGCYTNTICTTIR